MITIRFDFKDRKKEDLDQLNNILATMKLDELGIEDYKDYLGITTDKDGNLISKRYGLQSGTLVCRLSKNESGYQYSIDSEVINQDADTDEFLKNWRDAHPDRAVRIFARSEFDDYTGCLIIHHQRD